MFFKVYAFKTVKIVIPPWIPLPPWIAFAQSRGRSFYSSMKYHKLNMYYLMTKQLTNETVEHLWENSTVKPEGVSQKL